MNAGAQGRLRVDGIPRASSLTGIGGGPYDLVARSVKWCFMCFVRCLCIPQRRSARCRHGGVADSSAAGARATVTATALAATPSARVTQGAPRESEHGTLRLPPWGSSAFGLHRMSELAVRVCTSARHGSSVLAGTAGMRARRSCPRISRRRCRTGRCTRRPSSRPPWRPQRPVVL